ncbi:MAG: hypothetical protein QG622_957, partial [Actinomycetota bacterium]|nr:hypothetical protein [Actinomycetota bacterium]
MPGTFTVHHRAEGRRRRRVYVVAAAGVSLVAGALTVPLANAAGNTLGAAAAQSG